MKMKDAMNIMQESEKGFMVHFSKIEGHIERGDYFPDKHAGEELIKTESEAWELAERFAKASDENIVDIYVIDESFKPVTGYSNKQLKKKHLV